MRTRFCKRSFRVLRLFKTTGIFYSTLALLVIAPPSSMAYVLPGPHVLELMSQNSGKAKRLKVLQRVVLYDAEQADDGERTGGAIEFSETLHYIFPKKFRSDIETVNVQRIQLVSGNTTLTVLDGKISMDGVTGYDRYKDIFLYRSRGLLQEQLIRSGVDVQISSLGRFEGRIAFVVGAQYPDQSVSQLWVEKDSFRPIRWIITPRNGDTPDNLMDIRYYGWKRVNKLWYPSRIEFHNGHQLLREIQVDEILVDPEFNVHQFDINELKNAYRTASVDDDNLKSDAEMSEVQKAIEEFKKIYE